MLNEPDNLGARLREARRSKGVTQAEAAQGLGLSRPTLIAVEQGRRAPTPTELVNMARIYGRHVHELVRDTAPVEALAGRFRLGGGTEDETRQAVDTLQRVADDVVELEQLMGSRAERRWPAPYDTSGVSLDIGARQVADGERLRLGLGTGPLLGLREVLEDEYGIRVFAVSLPARIAGLFAIAEPIGACIAVNTKHPHERQRWTLAHELGHFLMHRNIPEVTPVEASRGRDERLAEMFAGYFLMPDEGLVRRFQNSRRARSGAFTAADLLQMAAAYEVSAQATAIRLEDARLVSSGWWDSLIARGLRVQEAKERIGVRSRAADKRLLPLRSQYLAVEAFLSGALSEGRLARTLNCDRVTARETIRRLSESSEIAPQGDLLSIELEFDDPANA